ncbi:MAG: hemerythrin domain-containing protein [Candidatus Omnitrophica bacterium]|nr:hemerythrin domain-containing protein [Candidatus Omnitrophota bacterium]
MMGTKNVENLKREELKAKSIRLPASHPISICKDEHKVIKRNLRRLKKLLEKLKTVNSFDKVKHQIDTLKELSHFFLETDKHHKREEEAIFPRLEAHGIVEPPQIFKEDHVEFMAKKRALSEAAMAADKKSFKEFLEIVGPIIEFLAKNLEDHIYKEDNILYPMALQTLEKSEWKDVRKKFDAIGYCCFAPADIVGKNKKRR